MSIRRLFSLLEKSRISPDISRLLRENSNTFDTFGMVNELNTDTWMNRLDMDKDLVLGSSSGLNAESPIPISITQPNFDKDYSRRTTEESNDIKWTAPLVTQPGLPYNPCTEAHTGNFICHLYMPLVIPVQERVCMCHVNTI
jgi:hypothetical protein